MEIRFTFLRKQRRRVMQVTKAPKKSLRTPRILSFLALTVVISFVIVVTLYDEAHSPQT